MPRQENPAKDCSTGSNHPSLVITHLHLEIALDAGVWISEVIDWGEKSPGDQDMAVEWDEQMSKPLKAGRLKRWCGLGTPAMGIDDIKSCISSCKASDDNQVLLRFHFHFWQTMLSQDSHSQSPLYSVP